MNKAFLQRHIDEFREVTGEDFAVTDPGGRILASTRPVSRDISSMVRAFVQRGRSSEYTLGFHFFRVEAAEGLLYVLIASAKYGFSDAAGRLAVLNLTHLELIHRKQYRKEDFYRELMEGKLSTAEIGSSRQRFCIPDPECRAVFLIEGPDERETGRTLKELRKIFPSGSVGIGFCLSRSHIILLKRIREEEGETPEQAGTEIADLLSLKERSGVRVACGGNCSLLEDLPRSYREAESAMETGRLFYPERRVISCEQMGLGRLVSQLSEADCRAFLKDVFRDESSFPDPASRQTAEALLKNSLNMAGASRERYLHWKTLSYRLDKLKEKTGLNIRRFEDAMTMAVALMVIRKLDAAAENRGGVFSSGREKDCLRTKISDI